MQINDGRFRINKYLPSRYLLEMKPASLEKYTFSVGEAWKQQGE
jgi:hypothetical protein